MNDRFRFRATFPVSYYDENGNDKDIKLTNRPMQILGQIQSAKIR